MDIHKRKGMQAGKTAYDIRPYGTELTFTIFLTNLLTPLPIVRYNGLTLLLKSVEVLKRFDVLKYFYLGRDILLC